MKKRITATLTALIMTFSLVSCGKSEISSGESKAETATTSVTTKAETKPKQKNDHELTQDEIMKKYGYKGKFDDKIFKTMMSNIKIDDVSLPYPCSKKEFEKKFTLGKESGPHCAEFYYNGYDMGFVCFNKKIYMDYLRLSFVGIEQAKMDKVELPVSVAGIRLTKDDTNTVIKYLGKPNKKRITKDGKNSTIFWGYEYKNYSLYITFHDNKKVYNIIIAY